MGVLTVQGPRSGRTYELEFAGDAPTDSEIARGQAFVQQQEDAFAQQYEQQFGAPLGYDDGTALGRGIDVGKTSAYGAIGTGLRDVGEATGFDWLQNFGAGMEQNAQTERLREATQLPAPTRLEDVTGLGSGLTFLGEVAGQSLPEMGATLGATALGTLAAGPVGGFTAGAATAAPFFYGRNIQRQEQQIAAGELAAKDRMDAFLSAGGQAALNTIGDKLLLTGRLFGINIPLSRNLFVRAGQSAATGAATEAPTEIMQQVLERAQAGMPLDDEEAIREYIEVGVAAGLLGGAIGGATGPFRATDDQAPAPTPEAAPEAAPAAPPALQAGLPTLSEGQSQGELFPQAPEQRAPEPLLLSPEQRVRPGEQLELPIQQPRVLQPSERVDAQREMELYAPRGTQLGLFGANPPTGRPAIEVMDELGIPKTAPIRKRLATAYDTDNRFLEELRRFSTLPGVKKATRTAVTSYLAKQAEPKPLETTRAEPAAEPTPVSSPTEEKANVEQGIADPIKTGRGASVPSPRPSMGDGDVGARGGADTVGTGSPDVGGLGTPSPTPADTAAPAGTQPTAVTQEAGVTLAYEKTRDPDKKYSDVRQVVANDGKETVGTVEGEVVKDERGKPTRTMRIYHSGLKEDLRGQKLGTKMYQEFIANAEKEGFSVESDNSVTASAARVYDSLKKAGYAVTQASDIRTKKDGGLETVSGGPVFTVSSAPAAPAFDINATPGRTLEQPLRYPEPNISRTQGRQLETQAAAQREPIARQLTKKAQLEAEAADVKAVLASRRKMTEQAKTKGIKRSALEAQLRKQLNRANTQLYNITSYLRSEEGRQQAAAEGTQNAVNMMERAENDSLRQQMRDWYELNAPVEVQAYDSDIRGDTAVASSMAVNGERQALSETDRAKLQQEQAARVALQAAQRDPTTVPDKRKLLELLSMAPDQLKKDATARAAYNYFSKTRDVADALDNIAFDSASPDVPRRRVGSPKQGAPLEGYWKGTGKDAAEKAAGWVETNLSEDSLAYMDEQIGKYVLDNGATISETLDAEQMNRIKRDEAETQYLKRYIDAEAALRDTAAFEGTTPEAMTREQLRALDQEAMGTDIDFAEIGVDIGRSLFRAPRRSIVYGLQASLHPAITKAVRNNNLQRVLEGLAATNTDPYVQQLAAALIPFVGDVKIYSSASFPQAANILTDPDTGERFRGTYVLMDKADMDRIAAEMSPEYAQAIQNAVFVDESTGMDAHTILHEVLHAATVKALSDPTNPVRARLETLRRQVAPLLDQEYGITDVMEFASEALSNQEFQTKLAQLYPNDRKASAFTQFWQTLANFVRTKLLRRAPRDYNAALTAPEAGAGADTVFDEVDFLVRTLFSAAPELRTQNSLYEDSRIPLRARERLDTMAGKVKDLKDLDRTKIEAALADAYIPMGPRRFIVDALVPLVNLMEYAKPYFPQAEALYKTLTGHAGAIHKMNERVKNTIDDINKFLTANPTKVDLFNEVRLVSSELQIDPRRPRDHYAGFTLVYKKVEPNGEISSTEIESFATAAERDAKVKELNIARQTAETTGKPVTRTRARKYADPDRETLEAYDHLRKQWEALGPEGKAAYNQIVALFEHMHRETGRVLKARLETMMPYQKRLANELYEDLYNKIIADQVIVPYQPLQRQGKYWIKYFANDERTGQPTLFKESFLTSADREAAMAKLRELPPEVGLKDLQAYMNVNDLFKVGRGEPPAKFVMDIGTMLDRQAKNRAEAERNRVLSQGGTIQDADAAAQSALAAEQARSSDTHAEIVKLALEMTPERSLLNSYRKRENIRGYLGDVTPVGRKLSRSDTVNFLMQKGANLSRQLANMEYGAQARAIVAGMKQDFEQKVATNAWGSKEQEKALVYLESLQDYAGSIYNDRSAYSKALTSLGFGMTLGANVSSGVMNFMAIPTIIGPYLGGKYGFRQTVKALGNAMKVVAGSGRERTVEFINENGEVAQRKVKTNLVDYSIDNYDLREGDKYFYLAEEARSRNMLHNSINYDTLDIEGSMGQGVWNKMNQVSGFMFHHLERFVREGTLIAAYDLELQKMQAEKVRRGQGNELTAEEMREAAREAAYATEMTNGSIASTASPKFAQSNIGAVLYLFKRYPLSMYNMLATLMNKSFPSKAKLAEMYGEGTPEYLAGLENRKIARMQLGSIVGSVGLWAGASGLPMYGAITGILDALFKDDDEEDFDTVIRKGIGEFGFKGLGNYLFGVEMSSRIGLANMMYREPLRADDQPFLFNVLEGAGGPVVGLMINFTDRVPSMMAQGEYYRALEAASPAAIRNFLRAARFQQNGAETMRGDQIIEDFGPLSIMGQALGFAPAEYIRQLEVNTQLKNIDTAILEEKSRLLRRMNMARREGNRLAMQDTLTDIRDYNRRHPQQAITQDTIGRSARTFEQTTQRVINGMIFNTKNIPVMEQMAREYDSNITVWDTLGVR
jgi:ribosomal protein S18 acetylase RimI-like enzyme